MAKVPIQLPRYFIRKTKSEAMAILCNYVKTNAEDFKNGEEIVLRYFGGDGSIISSNAIIDDALQGKVSFEIGEYDTLRIVEQEEEPEDKDALWLSDTYDGEEPATENMRAEIDSLKQKLKKLQDIVDKHEYSFNNAMSGGNVKANDAKFSLSNLAAQEEPEDVSDSNYDTTDPVIDTVKAFVGKYEIENNDKLFTKQNYYLSARGYNADGNLVSLSGCTILFEIENKDDVTIDTESVMRCETTGVAKLILTVITPESDSVSAEYTIVFTNQEQPQYYDEPTYHQFITKNAKNIEELLKYIDNVAIGEFCWCIAENTLYYRAKSANNTVQLFKINGSGSVEPEDSITYEITGDGILIISSESESVRLDENGILYLVGNIDENGVLHLNNQ